MHDNLHQLVARFSLTPQSAAQLWQIAGTDTAPPDFAKRISRMLIVVGALLLGLGAIFWLAANWQQWGRMAKFGLLQASLAGSLVAALALPRARVAALLLATLLLGALLAYIGQTYQTGADPWLLFAFWALLALPWMLAARRDLLWTFWVLIAAAGIGLWIGARPGEIFDMLFGSYRQVVVDWLMWFVLVAVAYGIQRLGLAGTNAKWTLRLALVLALVTVTTYAGMALFSENSSMFTVGLALVAAATAMLWVQKPRDFSALCVAVLGLDALLIAGWARLLANGNFDVGILLLFGLGAAVIVGGSVTLLLKLNRDPSETSNKLHTSKADAA